MGLTPQQIRAVQLLAKGHNQQQVADMVGDALSAVRDILTDPEARTCDRLKAAILVGDWAGLGADKGKMAEMEALKILIDANWVPNEVLEVLIEAGAELEEKMKDAFQNSYERAV
jgi:hypothetical protein